MTTRILAAKGALYQLLAGGFAYPASSWQQACRDGSLAEAVAESATVVGDGALMDAVARFRQIVAAENVQTCGLAEEYTFLFARQVQAPPYESRYLPAGPFGQPQSLADVGGFYAAFGFEVTGDLPDHLGAELEFLGALCLKEAYAHEQGWAEPADICQQARGRFLAEHLNRWLPVFVARLHEKARLPFYPALADVAAALVALEGAELGLAAAGAAEAWVRPAMPEDDGQCAA